MRAAPHDWMTAAEIAAMALPGLPGTKAGIQAHASAKSWQRADHEGRAWRKRRGRGGGVEYHASLLPMAAQAAMLLARQAAAEAVPEDDAGDIWEWFERQGPNKRAEALRRLKIMDAIEALRANGVPKVAAMMQVAAMSQVTLGTLYNWERLIAGIERADWLPSLAPGHVGNVREAPLPDAAWEFIKADYLCVERPNFTDCWRRLEDQAHVHGWTLPSARTVRRRLDAIPEAQRVLARKGVDALKRLFPAQQRDRGVFHAMEAVNIDGHTWDVFVRWPDGEVSRPVMVALQDLYSGLIVGWRIDRSENKHAVRLAIGDMVERYGIPDHCWLDNGRSFASKWITGGTANRYRFKVRPEEPDGLLTTLGVQIHWTTPYAGQSKPIERAFRDFAGGLAKHPAFRGAYTGNTPMAKPENYASKAVPLDTFVRVVGEGIAEHNARPGRRTMTAQGRSFAATFEASLANGAPVKRATATQARLWLLAAERVRVRSDQPAIHFAGNRYWSDFVVDLAGKHVAVRFDPDFLHDPIHVYALDGRYLGAALCVEAVGFDSAEKARAQARARRDWMRGHKAALDAQRRMSIDEVADAVAAIDRKAPEPSREQVVRPVFATRGATALRPVAEPADDPADDPYQNAVERMWGKPRLVRDGTDTAPD